MLGASFRKIAAASRTRRTLGSVRAALGAVGEEGDARRVADQAGAVPRRGERDVGQLLRRGLGHDGAVGEGEHRVALAAPCRTTELTSFTPGAVPIAQSAARSTSRVVSTAPATAALRLAQGDERRAEVGGIGGDVEGVHAVPDLVGPALPQVLRDPAEPRVVRRR